MDVIKLCKNFQPLILKLALDFWSKIEVKEALAAIFIPTMPSESYLYDSEKSVQIHHSILMVGENLSLSFMLLKFYGFPMILHFSLQRI